MLSGTLPEYRRKVVTPVFIVMFVQFVFLTTIALHELFWHVHSWRERDPRTVVPGLILLAAVFIATVIGLFQLRSRLITEFDYDGSVLHFQTLSRPEPRSRSIHELHEIIDWRTRGNRKGFILSFRDGQMLNVDISISTGPELIACIQRDRWPGHPPTL
jgi:hypothetical protein